MLAPCSGPSGDIRAQHSPACHRPLLPHTHHNPTWSCGTTMCGGLEGPPGPTTLPRKQNQRQAPPWSCCLEQGHSVALWQGQASCLGCWWGFSAAAAPPSNKVSYAGQRSGSKCMNPRQLSGPVQSWPWQGPDRISMTSAAGKWHQHDMHVWLRSAGAAQQPWQTEVVSKPHTGSAHVRDPLNSLHCCPRRPGTSSKHRGLHAGWFLPHHTAACRQHCAGSGCGRG